MFTYKDLILEMCDLWYDCFSAYCNIYYDMIYNDYVIYEIY